MLRHERDSEERSITPETPQKISYWLIPGEHHFIELQDIISELAEKFKGPTFEPHLTLFSGPVAPYDVPERLLQVVSNLSQPIRLECTSLNFSDSYTHCSFLTFKAQDSITGMTKCFREGSSAACDYHLQPHISLFYGMLSEDQQEAIRNLITIPTSVTFDRLWAVSTTKKVSNRSDVASWRLVDEVRLGHNR